MLPHTSTWPVGSAAESGRLEERWRPIFVSKCNQDRWIGAAVVSTQGADECAVAELKNDVMCSGFTEVRSDNKPVIFAPKGSAATALKLAGVAVKVEDSALYDS